MNRPNKPERNEISAQRWLMINAVVSLVGLVLMLVTAAGVGYQPTPGGGFTPGSETITATGGSTWSVPVGTTTLEIEIWGPGGTGGDGSGSGGGGGGGGAYCKKTLSSGLLSSYAYVVGATGTDSTVTNGGTVYRARTGAVGQADGTPGAGGTASNGDTNTSGSTGGTGSFDEGAEGGSGASPGGGAGGGGGNSGSPGNNGSPPGGGGGGAGTSGGSGGTGARGQIKFTYS